MTSTGALPGRRESVRSASCTFLSFAVPISMLGIIWPEVRREFDQSLGTLGLAALVYGFGRMSTALSGPLLTRRFGLGRSFVIVLVLLTAACLLTAAAPTWPVFLLGLASIGLMSGSLDSLGAGFITSIREVGTSGLVHGSYGVGATVGPLLVVALPGWRSALVVSATLVAAAAALAVITRDRWPQIAAARPAHRGAMPLGPVLLSLGAFGAFVAIEVTAGQWAFTYLTEHRLVGEELAAVGVALYWGGVTIGRLILVRPEARRLSERLGLPRLAAIACLLLAALAVVPTVLTVVTLACCGLALAPIVPSLFASTATRIGSDLAQRLAVWQLAATNLGAIGVPFLTGQLVDGIGPEVIVIVAAATAAAGAGLLVGIGRLPARPVEPH